MEQDIDSSGEEGEEDGNSGTRGRLEHAHFPLLDASSPSYGTLTEAFLRYIGEGNILDRHGYSARAGGFRFQINTEGTSAKSINYNGATLVVEDPCAPENNLSAHTYKMSEVQKALNDALEALRRGAVRSNQQMDIFDHFEGNLET